MSDTEDREVEDYILKKISQDKSSEIVVDSSDIDKVVNNGFIGDHVETESDISEDEEEEIGQSSKHQETSDDLSQNEKPQFNQNKVETESSDSSDTEEDEDVPGDESKDENVETKTDISGSGRHSEQFNIEEDHLGEINQDEEQAFRSPSPPKRSPSPECVASRSPLMEFNVPGSSSPERKDSRESEASYSNDERASSLSPEPLQVILAPPSSSKLSSPTSPPPSSHFKSGGSPITKIYTEALVDSDGEESLEKVTRNRPATDITQIYTAKLVEKEVESSSPKLERAFKGKAQGLDITQLYTAAFNKEGNSPTNMGSPVKPKRNENITKMYTGGFGKGQENGFKGKPSDELTNPKKHNMSTSMDKEAIKEAYNEVMADENGVEWAAFTFDGAKLGVTAKGKDFDSFKSHFGPDDRGFGYIKIMTGDEMSKRSRFVFCTWVGPNVSVMKKAKMSTDKALMKEIIQNLSVELQIENTNEFSFNNFKSEVDKAGGARYGTGRGEL